MTMKIKQNLFVLMMISLLAAALLLSGCGGGQTQAPQGGVFIGGTQGVVASFEPIGVKENEIYTIYDTEAFPLEILLKNKGEEPIQAGKAELRLIGPPQSDFRNIPSWTVTNAAVIDKLSEFNPEGGEEIVKFTPNQLALYQGKVVGSLPITWNLEYTYDYKTRLIVNDVCFKGDVKDEEKVCNVKEAKTFSLSGAPIAVTTVQEDTAGKGIIMLQVTIKNIGGGDATVPGEEFDTRFSQVSYQIDEPNLWECKSGGRENMARFVGDTAQVNCKLKSPLAETDIYTKTVSLDINYQYKELIQEKMLIKESVKN